jgi:glyoxylase I family protein
LQTSSYGATFIVGGPEGSQAFTNDARFVHLPQRSIRRDGEGRVVVKDENRTDRQEDDMPTPTDSTSIIREKQGAKTSLIQGVHGVRYQVKDVARSVAFYTTHLGFTLEHQQLPAFASVSLGGSHILLSGPQASGSRTMPDGQRQEPGGWNRVVLRVADLPALIEVLKNAGLHFRNQMETGPGGKQIQVEDPDGNPIELFEPVR